MENEADIKKQMATREPMGQGMADPLDKELLAAAEAISTCRQERAAYATAVQIEKLARHSSENALADSRRQEAELGTEYHNLLRHYKELRAHWAKLQEQNISMCSEITLERGKLEVLQKTIDEHKDLREAVEIQYHQARDELSVIKDWNSHEIEARDATIEELRREVQSRDLMVEELTQHVQVTEQTKDEEIKAEAMAHHSIVAALEGSVDELRKEIADLEVQNMSATALIANLENGFVVDEKHHPGDILERWEEMNREPSDNALRQAEAERARLESENATLRRQIDVIREAVASHFPAVHEDMGNITEVLEKLASGSKAKKRKRGSRY